MKRVFLSAVFLLQMLVAFAQGPTTRVNAEQVKLFRQPATKAEVMQVLSPEDEIIVLRKFNSQWSLVQIGEEAGYIQNSFLKAKKVKNNAERKMTAKK